MPRSLVQREMKQRLSSVNLYRGAGHHRIGGGLLPPLLGLMTKEYSFGNGSSSGKLPSENAFIF